MTLDTQTVQGFLSSLGDRTPTPGGGAVAAMAAAIGAAQTLMVVRYSIGKRTLTEHQPLLQDAERTLATLRARALELADEDAKAYEQLQTVWKLDASDPRRQAEMPAAVRGAIAVPEQTLASCLELLELCRELCGRTNRMLASDLAIAALLAEAGARAAAWNVRINLPQLEDPDEAGRIEQATADRLQPARRLVEEIERGCTASS